MMIYRKAGRLKEPDPAPVKPAKQPAKKSTKTLKLSKPQSDKFTLFSEEGRDAG